MSVSVNYLCIGNWLKTFSLPEPGTGNRLSQVSNPRKLIFTGKNPVNWYNDHPLWNNFFLEGARDLKCFVGHTTTTCQTFWQGQIWGITSAGYTSQRGQSPERKIFLSNLVEIRLIQLAVRRRYQTVYHVSGLVRAAPRYGSAKFDFSTFLGSICGVLSNV